MAVRSSLISALRALMVFSISLTVSRNASFLQLAHVKRLFSEIEAKPFIDTVAQ